MSATSSATAIRRNPLAQGWRGRAAVAALVAAALALFATAARSDPAALGWLRAHRWLAALGLFGGTLAALAATYVALRRRDPARAELVVRATHVVPIVAQVILFSYWTAYWPQLGRWLPFLFALVAFALATDATMSWIVRHRLVLGFGPVPITLGMHLFAQFSPVDWHAPAAMLLLAIGSKALVSRDGHPLVNPSAFGLACVGAATLVAPAVGYGDVAFRFNLPPSMTELILLVTLLPQIRQPIVLVSIGAFLGNELTHYAFGFSEFRAAWAPVTLGLALFATDPATTPRRNPGRLLFGVAYGVAMVSLAHALEASGRSDFYAKVIPIPLLNVLAPTFDRLGDALVAARPRLARALEPRWNLAHIAAWVLVITLGLVGQKERTFLADQHTTEQTRGVRRDARGEITCELNRPWCRPWDIGGEIATWVR